MTVGRIPNIEGGIQPTLLTTTGDIMYASSASNPARLGIGSSAQVLTVASGVPSWATPSSGGMTLISTTALTGASVTLSSIPQTYKSLFLLIYGVTNATADGVFAVNPNNDTSSTTQAVQANAVATSTSDLRIAGVGSVDYSDRANSNNAWQLSLYNYTSTTNLKPFNFSGQYVSNGSNRGTIGGGAWRVGGSAITSILLKNYGGNLSTGTVELYGVN